MKRVLRDGRTYIVVIISVVIMVLIYLYSYHCLDLSFLKQSIVRLVTLGMPQ